MAKLRARRRDARQRSRLLRLDLTLGVLGGVALLLATAGLAIAALIALILIVLCVVSVAIERRHSRRRWGRRERH